MKHLEQQLQVSCIQWFDIKYPHLRALFFHIPNGGKRNIREAARFKKMGVRAGVPDLFLSIAKNGFHGLFIELKAGKNSLTDTQKTFLKRVDEGGYKTVLIKTIDEFMREVERYLYEGEI